MPEPQPARRYRFGLFEADVATGELRRQGIRIKLNAQPFQLLTLLLSHPGELLTRDEIARSLWPEETFVDFDHGVHSAINRIREALGDTASNPRFVETLARRGYRFIAPVERTGPAEYIGPAERTGPAEYTGPAESIAPVEAIQPASTLLAEAASEVETETSPPPDDELTLDSLLTRTYLATPEELPRTSRPVVQTLFVLLQIMYLGYYVGALANLPEISDLLSQLPHASDVFITLVVTATALIPVRAFVLSAALFHPPSARKKLLRLWPFLLPFDILWALSPFLLLHHINFGLALACVPLLVYSPFAQRSLVLMGAAEAHHTTHPRAVKS
jgi:DNA-binding winged helix-turn-helix (wHTH) protein